MHYKIALCGGVLGAALFAVVVFAAPNISFPIAELGNCADRMACETYCDVPDHVSACISFAEHQGIMSKQEVKAARNMVQGMAVEGPGGCDSERSCRAYCDGSGHTLECLEFALANDIVPPGELAEARQVLRALQAGARPPGDCGSKQSCEAYCDNPDHTPECIEFALAAGFVSAEEAEMIRKTGGRGPGGCRGEVQCEPYRASGGHMLECMEFALQYDLVPANEVAEMRQIMKALKTGVKMPNCMGEAECDVYCSEPAHLDECVSFATAAGFMSAEDAARVRKMGTMSGPGGCKGDECEAFCNNPANAEECLSFAVRVGDMSSEEAEQIKRDMAAGHRPGEEGHDSSEERPPGLGGCGSQAECEAYCRNPANAQECLEFAVGIGQIRSEEAVMMMERVR